MISMTSKISYGEALFNIQNLIRLVLVIIVETLLFYLMQIRKAK